MVLCRDDGFAYGTFAPHGSSMAQGGPRSPTARCWSTASASSRSGRPRRRLPRRGRAARFPNLTLMPGLVDCHVHLNNRGDGNPDRRARTRGRRPAPAPIGGQRADRARRRASRPCASAAPRGARSSQSKKRCGAESSTGRACRWPADRSRSPVAMPGHPAARLTESTACARPSASCARKAPTGSRSWPPVAGRRARCRIAPRSPSRS